jgi:hypothetical protein
MFILFDDSEYSHEFQRKQKTAQTLRSSRKEVYVCFTRPLLVLGGLHSSEWWATGAEDSDNWTKLENTGNYYEGTPSHHTQHTRADIQHTHRHHHTLLPGFGRCARRETSSLFYPHARVPACWLPPFSLPPPCSLLPSPIVFLSFCAEI